MNNMEHFYFLTIIYLVHDMIRGWMPYASIKDEPENWKLSKILNIIIWRSQSVITGGTEIGKK